MGTLTVDPPGARPMQNHRAELWRAGRLWAVVRAFGVLAVTRSIQVGVLFRNPHAAFLGTRLARPQARYMEQRAQLLAHPPRRSPEVGPEHATHGSVGSGTR